MASKNLTVRVVESLKTKQSQEDFWDSAFRVRGVSFGVRVTNLGSKEYIVRYRLHGKYRRMSIGDAAKTTLAKAHQKAIDLATQLENGKDPAELRDDYKVAESCAELFELYLKRHASRKKDGGAEDKRIIARDLIPAIGVKKACDVTRRDIIGVLDHISNDRGAVVMSNRTRALLSKIFNFAVEREILSTTPCVGLSSKAKESSRGRVLVDDELKSLFTALENESEVLRELFFFLLATAARSGEVIEVRWTEIDFKSETWTLPSNRSKNGKTHILPLPRPLLLRLKKLHLLTGGSEFLFPSNRNDFVSLRTVQNSIARIIRRTNCTHFTAHDLRRSAATGIRSLGAPREVVSKILNHSPKSVTEIYDRHHLHKEMKDALTDWANHLEDQTDSAKRRHVKSARA